MRDREIIRVFLIVCRRVYFIYLSIDIFVSLQLEFSSGAEEAVFFHMGR